jgi:RWD domain
LWVQSIFPDFLSDGDGLATDRTVKLEIPVELNSGGPTKRVVLHSEQDDRASTLKDADDSPDARRGRLALDDAAMGGPRARMTDTKQAALSSQVVEDCYTQRTVLSLSTLPPLLFTLIIPVDYPIHRPPIIVSLHARYSWVPRMRLNMLEKSLLSIWKTEQMGQGEGRGVLYDWIETIRSAEFLDHLGFVDFDTVQYAPYSSSSPPLSPSTHSIEWW